MTDDRYPTVGFGELGGAYHRSWGTGVSTCCCVGPRNAEPYCPCRMRIEGIFERDGRWVKPAEPECDLGSCNSPEIERLDSYRPEGT